MISNRDLDSVPNRRFVISCALLGLLTAISLVGLMFLDFAAVNQPAWAAETEPIRLRPATPERQISLRDRLLTGLRARLKSEVAFVDAVVARVEAGELPVRLVDETFFWARLRAAAPLRGGRVRRPIIYFQPAMIARADRLGIEL